VTVPSRSLLIALAKANLQSEADGALFERLARALKQAIADGHLGRDARLPATRDLAKAMAISRNTVVAAYELLSADSIIVSRGGSGTRVAAQGLPTPVHKAPAPESASRYAMRARSLGPITLVAGLPVPRYDLHHGEPLVHRRIFNAWRRKLAAATLRARSGYPCPWGFMPLREAICGYVKRKRGIECEPDDILIVSGTQQALTLVSRVVLNEGDAAVIEDPHYQMAAHALVAHGARVISVRTDQDGIVTADLPREAARLIYVTPTHQFPSGVTLSQERRLELLRIAARTQSWVFEDDYDSEIHFDGKPLPTLYSLDTSHRVIYAGTFSKTVFPTLRLGYIICPPQLRQDLYKAKLLDDLGCPSIEQAALAGYLQSGQVDKHLQFAVRELRQRRLDLLRALADHLGDQIEIGGQRGGMHVAIWFKGLDYCQFEQLLHLGAVRGLGLHPMTPYYTVRPIRPGMLLAFTSLTSLQLKVAVEILGQCLSEALQRPAAA
jgi:GntR family transcriptional regulator / MocR family aminotransferase